MVQAGQRGVKDDAGKGRKRLKVALGGICLLIGCFAVRYFVGPDHASADSASSTQRTVRRPAAPQRTTSPRTTSSKTTRSTSASESRESSKSNGMPAIVAKVNGRPITREELAKECLLHYGEEVLESVVNKLLIDWECKRLGIKISQADVSAEIERLATRFGLPKNKWFELLEEERGINPTQYANDIIWPTLALRKLAGRQLTVTPDELSKAWETRYGPAIRARMIACSDPARAQQLQKMAAADPTGFGDLAKAHSEDKPSASMKGSIPPIRKHSQFKEIEQAAFTMADGEVSRVIPVAGQYVIIKREAQLPGEQSVSPTARAELEELIRDSKLRTAAGDIFAELKKRARVEEVLTDPVKRRQWPNTAVLLNGSQLTMDQLAEQCLARHGEEVLEGTINRRLIELACEKQKITVSPAEIDTEIARAAGVALPLVDGKPDIEGYIKLMTEEQGISEEVYRHTALWPTVALKKMVRDRVQVTQDDLGMGFEANYGPRVRCLAIVLDDQRRAQRVWGEARDNRTAEHFAKLARQYSIEPGGRALAGEVPPIKRHGGRPELEEEAFALKPGELSRIVQVDKRYIILHCLGQTTPTVVDFQEVKELIEEDVFEKKLRREMARQFQTLQDMATVDNFVAKTTRRPKRPAGPAVPMNALRPGQPTRR